MIQGKQKLEWKEEDKHYENKLYDDCRRCGNRVRNFQRSCV